MRFFLNSQNALINVTRTSKLPEKAHKLIQIMLIVKLDGQIDTMSPNATVPPIGSRGRRSIVALVASPELHMASSEKKIHTNIPEDPIQYEQASLPPIEPVTTVFSNSEIILVFFVGEWPHNDNMRHFQQMCRFLTVYFYFMCRWCVSKSLRACS